MSLSLRGVVATAGAARILRGVDLDVPDGSCMAVLGPSGAGKTTLLRVIAGLQPTSDGTVSVDGTAIDDVATQDRNLALVFQDARLFPSMDVATNVAFPLRMAAGPDVTSTALVAEALASVGLDGFGPRKVRGLSGGEQQRVALARALVGSPRLLLLDEPFGAVDPDRRAELRSLVNRLRTERRMTTLLVTHDRDDAALVGDEIAIMLNGRIVQSGPPRDVFERPASAEAAVFVGCEVHRTGPAASIAMRPEQVRLHQGPHRGAVTAITAASDQARVEIATDLGAGAVTITASVGLDDAPPLGATIDFALPHAWPVRTADGDTTPLATDRSRT